MMFLESSFFPFPSEIVIIPAGYLAFKGEMNIYLVIFFGIIGSILGSLLNYYIAYFLGKPFILKYGKYFKLTEERFDKLNIFFIKHGAISTFIGRLIPGVRQYISFPAGLSKLSLTKFITYTTLGAGLWVTILAIIGYLVGNNQALIHKYSKTALISVLALSIVLVITYIFINKKNGKKESV
jgi:membrane protein DedA with SNARE-associated domain